MAGWYVLDSTPLGSPEITALLVGIFWDVREVSLVSAIFAFACVFCLAMASVASIILRKQPQKALKAGTAITLTASLLGAAASVWALVSKFEDSYETLWSTALGPFTIGLDPLSSFFLLCVFLVGGLAALYGYGYVKNHPEILKTVLVWFPILLLSMALVVVSSDAMTFLLAWELMTLSSFLLVTADGERTSKPGLVYLLASQLGVVALFAMFAILATGAGSLHFDDMRSAGQPAIAGVVFLLGLLGFGTKAGFWPVHVWLPLAHPAAPSQVSAVMSGVMIKLGIYGLLRMLTFLGTPNYWWGVVLIMIGTMSGMGGIIQAMAQDDLKRILAYSSVENLGIVALGLGLGVLGLSANNNIVATLGFAGALLHVLNHGLYKGLLFQSAGVILGSVKDLNQTGGLIRQMPVTGYVFLTGSAAITGVPTLNGFISELLIFVGAFYGATLLPASQSLWAVAVVPILATLGGLTAVTFVKIFGTAFLGTPRSGYKAKDTVGTMKIALLIGVTLCFIIGIFPAPFVVLVKLGVTPLVSEVQIPQRFFDFLVRLPLVFIGLGAIFALLIFIRRRLLQNREVRAGETWACGYESVSPKMQYTAASFADPALSPAHFLLDARRDDRPAKGAFPKDISYELRLGDRVTNLLWKPAVDFILALSTRTEKLKRSDVRSYLILVLITLVSLLLWQAWVS